MRIAYIHQYFKTPEEGGAIRSYYLSKKMYAAGHSVVVITSHNKSQILIKEINGVQVHYLPVKYDNKMGVLARLYAFIKFYSQSFKQIKILADIDLVYATSTPLTIGLIALRIKRKLGIPFVFEVRDLWPDAPIEMGYVPLKVIGRLIHIFERRIYEKADQIIALSQGMARRISMRCESTPISVVPNISDTEFYSPSQPSASEKVVAYFGALGPVNGLDDLMLIAKEAQKRNLHVRFKVFGTGKSEASLRQFAINNQLENIKFYGLLNKFELRKELGKVDIAYISFADHEILETSSPNKFFDALAAGKAVITNTGGWIKELIEENGLGFYYERGRPDQFFSNLDQLAIPVAQQNARKLAEERFSVDILAGHLLQVLDNSSKPVLRKLA